jgi:hypothetical protein
MKIQLLRDHSPAILASDEKTNNFKSNKPVAPFDLSRVKAYLNRNENSRVTLDTSK